MVMVDIYIYIVLLLSMCVLYIMSICGWVVRGGKRE